MMDDTIVFRLIAQNRLPRADALDGAGRPCWRLDSLATHWRLDLGELLQALPARIEGRQYAEVAYEVSQPESIPTD